MTDLRTRLDDLSKYVEHAQHLVDARDRIIAIAEELEFIAETMDALTHLDGPDPLSLRALSSNHSRVAEAADILLGITVAIDEPEAHTIVVPPVELPKEAVEQVPEAATRPQSSVPVPAMETPTETGTDGQRSYGSGRAAVVTFLFNHRNKDEWYTAQDISDQIGVKPGTVGSILFYLHKGNALLRENKILDGRRKRYAFKLRKGLTLEEVMAVPFAK